MKKLLLISLVLAGCSTFKPEPPTPVVSSPKNVAETPEPVIVKLRGYNGPVAMEDVEVLQASKQCMYAKLRPNVEYTTVRIDTGGKVLVPIRVHCEPE